MRVGIIGPDYLDTFADNIAVTLESMGVPTVRLGPARPRLGHHVASSVSEFILGSVVPADVFVQQRLVRRALAFGCNVVISVDARLLIETVRALRAGGARVAMWYPDAVANLGRQLMLACPYDAIYFKDPCLVSRLNALLDLPIRYLPEACNPIWHRPPDEVAPRRYVAVVGNLYPSRVGLLNRLLRDQIPLVLYGSGFPRWLKDLPTARVVVRAPVFGSAKARVFREAAAVLNNLHPGEMASVNARLFEATGSGGVVLCEHRSALDSLFTPETEVLVFRTYRDLIERIEWVLSDPMDARSIGDAASRRAHAEHTYEHRIRVILQDLS